MKHLSAHLPSTSQIAAAMTTGASTPAPGSISTDGRMTTRLAQSRQNGLADAPEVSKLANQLLGSSLWPTAPSAEARAHRVAILREAQTVATYEDAAFWMVRFVSNFVPRSAEQHAFVTGEVCNACKLHQIPVVALRVALVELLQSATGKDPYLPVTGEIISKARSKADLYASCLARDTEALGLPLYA